MKGQLCLFSFPDQNPLPSLIHRVGDNSWESPVFKKKKKGKKLCPASVSTSFFFHLQGSTMSVLPLCRSWGSNKCQIPARDLKAKQPSKPANRNY